MLKKNPQLLFKDYLVKAELHITRGRTAREEIQGWDLLSPAVFLDPEKVKTIDSFIFRFVKLQDLIGQKLFKLYLDVVGELQDDMSFLDVLDRLEKLHIIKDSDRWFGFRRLRNELTHEYPDNESEIIEGITLALEAFDETVMIIDRLNMEAKRFPGE